MMLASILAFTASAGYPVLFVLIMAESGGTPLPGETALITAAALAGQGKLSLPLVIAIAAAAAIIGDNLGYLLARRYGRGLLEHSGPRRLGAPPGPPPPPPPTRPRARPAVLRAPRTQGRFLWTLDPRAADLDR